MISIFRHEITTNSQTVFSWAFQQRLKEPEDEINGFALSDFANIYSINVTNTMYGGAEHCVPCPKGADQDG